MTDVPRVGPGSAARWLPDGFTREQTDRLVALKRRRERGEFRELTDADRLRFARWLVEHGWLDEFRLAGHPRRGGDA